MDSVINNACQYIWNNLQTTWLLASEKQQQQPFPFLRSQMVHQKGQWQWVISHVWAKCFTSLRCCDTIPQSKYNKLKPGLWSPLTMFSLEINRGSFLGLHMASWAMHAWHSTCSNNPKWFSFRALGPACYNLWKEGQLKYPMHVCIQLRPTSDIVSKQC